MTDSLSLRDLQTGQVYPCPLGRSLMVGRVNSTHSVDIGCDDPHVSRQHCELRAQADGTLWVRSRAETSLNGCPLEGEQPARPGDRLVLAGGYELEVQGPSAPEAPALRVEVGAVIQDRYWLARLIGQGGMGVVFQAEDLHLGSACALKFLHLAGIGGADERFAREAQVARSLGEHPSIVSVTDFGSLPTGVPFLVMDYVEGVSLERAAQAGLTLAQAANLLLQTASAVAFAHARGVVHRDLKPDNVLVDPQGRVHLTDFGIAKIAGSQLTATGESVGTPGFMAPEQLRDSKRIGTAADVYGLGGLLYTALTGRVPYPGQVLVQVMRDVLAGRLVPPSHHVPGLPPDLDALCLRALAIDPDQRPPSAAAFLTELQACL
jgi:hypothetical protein